MVRHLERYPEYKDSGLPWLGVIPAHWEIRRNGRLFSQRNENGFPDLPILEVSLKTGVRVRGLDNQKRKQMMADRAKYKRAVRGDIAYNMMRLWQGAVGVAPVDGLVSPAYVVAKPHSGTNSRYYAYLFRTAAYMNEVNKYSHGIVTDRNRLYWDEFKQMPSVFPPPDEQAAIANYLDHHGALVSQYVRNKRRLIELLKEQKKAVIQQAVTRGLDSNVRTKSSGIDWLGDIPAHWEVKRLKYLVRNLNEQAAVIGDGELYVALEHVESWTGRLQVAAGLPGTDSQVKRFRSGDILFGKLRPYLAKVIRMDRPGVCVGEFLVLRVIEERLLPEFLELKLRSPQIIDVVNSSTFGAKMPRADWNFVGGLPIAFPPSPSEQHAILNGVCRSIARLDGAIARIQREIDLIREYRTRLIADVVTGRVDVRSLAPAVTDVPQSIEDITGEAAAAEDEEVLPEEAAEEVAIGNE